MPFFESNGISFHFADDDTDRTPFVFQHGLGADISQPMAFFGEDRPFRLISLDCRGHGKTVPLGDRQFLNFNSLTDDLTLLLDYLNLAKVVIGGISMGSGVALNFAVRHPERIRALILSRASWLTEPLPPNLTVFPKIAGLIREYGAQRGKELFAFTAEYQTALRSSPANAASLMVQFLRKRADETFDILESIPNDVPVPDIASLKKIDVPALVLACRNDLLHPFEYGQVLAREIPGAQFAEITAKATSEQKHVEEVHWEISEFIGSLERNSQKGGQLKERNFTHQRAHWKHAVFFGIPSLKGARREWRKDRSRDPGGTPRLERRAALKSFQLYRGWTVPVHRTYLKCPNSRQGLYPRYPLWLGSELVS